MNGIKMRIILAAVLMTLLSVSTWAQSAFEFISQNRNFSASNYCIYPDSVKPYMTPPPAGKRPFYISHYGCHGSRYLNNRKGYDIPFRMLCSADSMGELTQTGKETLQELQLIISDSEGRWGDLSGLGKLQHRNIARRMMKRFPEVFRGNASIDAKSTTVTHCILSMGSALQEMKSINPKLNITMDASNRTMFYMNHQDRKFRDSLMTAEATKAYDNYCSSRIRNPRLMEKLFIHPDSVRKVVDEEWLNYYLLKTALIQQNTHMDDSSTMIDLFSFEEIHQFWQRENAWWYLVYGPSPHSGGYRHYSQRYLLRQIIQDADSCLQLPNTTVQLRYGHETVVLPLTCLLGINGFDLQTDNLEDLEENGWWACLVFPMASNIQLVFYRSGPTDRDVIFKVLLNEAEAMLPIQTDIAPYYHWRDFREYYLKKLDEYDACVKVSPNPALL